MFIPLDPNIFYVEAPGKGRFPYSHSLFITGDTNVLIDTSCGFENLEHLQKTGVDIIINTHFHEDHMLNNHLFAESSVWAHADDAPAMRSLDVFADYYGFIGEEMMKLGQGFIEAIGLQPSKVDRELQADEILDFGAVKLRVIHTPGHTPGHCCFYEEKKGLLFLGDIDLSSFGPWYGHMCSDIDDFITSIEKCIQIDPAIAISSHKGLYRGDVKPLLQQYLDEIFVTQDLILAKLATPHSLEEITDEQFFYGKKLELDPLYRAMEQMAVFLHLQRLIKLGQVQTHEDLYYLSA